MTLLHLLWRRYANAVFSLEKVCHDHAQMMCVRSDQSNTEVSGHAMMMSCPPPDHVRDHPTVTYPHQAPDLPAVDLMKLYDLSTKLPLGGEITPVQALQLIRCHERYGELTAADYDTLQRALQEKSRCYGYVARHAAFAVIFWNANRGADARWAGSEQYSRSLRSTMHSIVSSRPNSGASRLSEEPASPAGKGIRGVRKHMWRWRFA